jgi:hypothetical protein
LFQRPFVEAHRALVLLICEARPLGVLRDVALDGAEQSAHFAGSFALWPEREPTVEEIARGDQAEMGRVDVGDADQCVGIVGLQFEQALAGLLILGGFAKLVMHVDETALDVAFQGEALGQLLEVVTRLAQNPAVISESARIIPAARPGDQAFAGRRGMAMGVSPNWATPACDALACAAWAWRP